MASAAARLYGPKLPASFQRSGSTYISIRSNKLIFRPMDQEQAEKRVQELRDLLDRANKAYYQEAQPFISDKEFDEYLKELEKLEEEYGLQSPDSPTMRVGGEPSSDFPTVQHPIPLLSLDNTYNEEELNDFDRRVRVSGRPFRSEL